LYSKLQYTPYQPYPARLGSGFFADQGARLRQIHKAPKTALLAKVKTNNAGAFEIIPATISLTLKTLYSTGTSLV